MLLEKLMHQHRGRFDAASLPAYLPPHRQFLPETANIFWHCLLLQQDAVPSCEFHLDVVGSKLLQLSRIPCPGQLADFPLFDTLGPVCWGPLIASTAAPKICMEVADAC